MEIERLNDILKEKDVELNISKLKNRDILNL